MPIFPGVRHQRRADVGRGVEETIRKAGVIRARVQARIAEIMRAGAERAEVTVEQVVRELKLLGFSDIRKVVSWRNELVTRTEKGEDGEPVMVPMPRVTIVDADKISDEAAAAIAEVSQNANGSLRIKMHDKHAALGAANTGAGLKGLRDRALLLIGFAGALRRSELVALNIEDIEEAPDGMKITIRHSKTDQEGAGQTIAIPSGKIACPVAALKEWITAAGIGSGALFRSVKRHGKVGERPIKACLTL